MNQFSSIGFQMLFSNIILLAWEIQHSTFTPFINGGDSRGYSEGYCHSGGLKYPPMAGFENSHTWRLLPLGQSNPRTRPLFKMDASVSLLSSSKIMTSVLCSLYSSKYIQDYSCRLYRIYLTGYWTWTMSL